MENAKKEEKFEIEIMNTKYILEKNYRNCFNIDDFTDVCTEYFKAFDYIVGDYSYDKLRLKGLYDSNNVNINHYNDIKVLDDYIHNYCSYGAKYFLLKKIK